MAFTSSTFAAATGEAGDLAVVAAAAAAPVPAAALTATMPCGWGLLAVLLLAGTAAAAAAALGVAGLSAGLALLAAAELAPPAGPLLPPLLLPPLRLGLVVNESAGTTLVEGAVTRLPLVVRASTLVAAGRPDITTGSWSMSLTAAAVLWRRIMPVQGGREEGVGRCKGTVTCVRRRRGGTRAQKAWQGMGEAAPSSRRPCSPASEPTLSRAPVRALPPLLSTVASATGKLSLTFVA